MVTYSGVRSSRSMDLDLIEPSDCSYSRMMPGDSQRARVKFRNIR